MSSILVFAMFQEEILDGYREIISNAHGQLSEVLLRVPDVPLV